MNRLRTIGLLRAGQHNGLCNLVYNMDRYAAERPESPERGSIGRMASVSGQKFVSKPEIPNYFNVIYSEKRFLSRLRRSNGVFQKSPSESFLRRVSFHEHITQNLHEMGGARCCRQHDHAALAQCRTGCQFAKIENCRDWCGWTRPGAHPVTQLTALRGLLRCERGQHGEALRQL